jgi:hypothetical protein
MATLHKSADKINNKRKAKASANDLEEMDVDEEELPQVSLKPVKRRKDKVRLRSPDGLSSLKR